MNARILKLLAALFATASLPALAQETPEAVREFTSKSGSKLKAMVMGVEAGKVLLQRYAPSRVSLRGLSADDQVYVKDWLERQAKEKEFIRQGWLNEFYSDPGISMLKDAMRTLEDGKWKPYEPKNVENLQFVAYYFTKEWPEDRFIGKLSDTYKKLRKRSDLIEVVYVTLGKSDQAVRDYIKEKKVEFPVIDPAQMGVVRSDTVTSHFKGTYPQLIVVDRNGQLKADSFAGKNSASKFTEALDEMEKLVKAAVRLQKNPPTDPAE